MKQRIIKIFSLFLALWVTICFLMSAYSFTNKPMYGYGNSDRNGYGNFDASSQGDDIDITINEFKEGDFYGAGVLTIKSKEAKEAYIKGERPNILISNISSSKNIFPMPNWLSLKSKDKINGADILVSDKNKIYSRGDYFYFPFDTYKVEMHLGFQIYSGVGYDSFQKTADSGSVYFNLPRSFSLSRINEIPVEECDFDDCKITHNVKVEKKDFYYEIKRQKWFIWLSLGLIGVVFAPVILLLKAKVESMGIDIIASLVSIYTLRSLLIGTSTNIYFLDFVLGFVIWCIVTIAMLKIASAPKGSE